jgi:hypothetical protein
MYMHPETFLWLHEQDRERQATKRALERAARGGERDDGTARGGISGRPPRPPAPGVGRHEPLSSEAWSAAYPARSSSVATTSS